MICENCRFEADMVKDFDHARHDQYRSSKAGHDVCKGGTHCVCQHKPVGSWKGEPHE